MSASLDKHKWFAVGNDGKFCWHALRLHHRSRLLRAPETACEFIGSIMHQQFSANQDLAPAPLMDRVMLQQAHVRCVGSQRDELLVSETAKLLIDMGKSTTVAKRTLHTGRPLKQIQDMELQLINSGRHAEDLSWLASGELLRPDLCLECRHGLPVRKRRRLFADLPCLLLLVAHLPAKVCQRASEPPRFATSSSRCSFCLAACRAAGPRQAGCGEGLSRWRREGLAVHSC